jgi:tRNA nucleotidyltransferase/poly(A) polymerase
MEKWEQMAKEFFPKEFEGFRRSLSGGRRPDSVSFTNIEGDVKRRDLTINALFYDIDTNEVVDLVGGVNDLKNGVVRTVGAAEDRFGEDRLRILRAIRFAGRFGSQLDPETDDALKKDASLEGISAERIRDEFLKGIASAKSVNNFLKMIDGYGLFGWVFKGLAVDKDFVENNDSIIVIANILKKNNIESLRKDLNNLKYSADEVKAISFLIGLIKLSTETAVLLKRAQKNSGVTPEQMKTFGKIVGIDSRLLDTFIKFELSVSGPELMDKMNLKPGPELGQAIQKVETDNFKKLLG